MMKWTEEIDDGVAPILAGALMLLVVIVAAAFFAATLVRMIT